MFMRYSVRVWLWIGILLECLVLSASGEQAALKVAEPHLRRNAVSLEEFGGMGNGVKLNTEAFAKALDALSRKGGGRLVVSPGIWLTGPIKLRSGVDLHLERGAVIQFSRDYKLYPLTIINLKGEKEVDSTSPISGENLEDVAITGSGIIDGGGDAWRPIKKGKLGDADWNALVQSGGDLNERGDTWYPSREVAGGGEIISRLRQKNSLHLEDYEPAHQYLRPKMVRLIGCKRVLLQGVTFQNPPNWTLNPVLCDDVSIVDVEVRNSPVAQNSDALDLESCRRTLVRNCIFDAGDDGICLKSGKDEAGRRIGMPTEDVLIEGCTVYHAHGGFTIGSEMSGGVRNVHVSNCTFMGTDVGLRFKTTRGRGGIVEDIYVSNVRMENLGGEAISFNMYYGGQSPLDENGNAAESNTPPVTDGTPQFRAIHIENIVCRGARKAIVLEGLPEMPLRDIELKDVDITAKEGVSVTDAENITFENVRVENTSGPVLTQTRVKNSKLDLNK
jgi:polygalacturonase